jgi:2-amino-4-hydroxy-6-hydroxymethyldihydropteridine diphosphokinase
VVELTTKYLPSELFKNLQRFERGIGRKPRWKWSEREIDLDILLYDELLYADGALTIPHPEMINRDFVLTPLLELNGALCFPGTHTSFASFRDALQIRYIERRVPEITFEQYVGKRKLC